MTLEFHRKEEPARTLIGLPIRSSHATAWEDIPAFWQKVMEGQLLAELGETGTIYAVYTDYEGDWQAPYTMLLAVECDAEREVPEGMRRVQVPAQTWASATLPDGSPETVWASWTEVWERWEERERRTYEVDLEIYRFGQAGPQVELQIGLEEGS
ncbi:AraC family transcriptional regulator [Lujinxingia vulgaris]|uniref:AraC family transcriptional regulator n=1 Tax=Lujinxingia vulgaris TaxID=2600176 RepID=A0A5C6X5U6_9DELT|nr:effector binding domain-containing protein [Lujinxingia vulgaris]TXD35646.1 AraC family transcriptional regulator [Lujinxingia vulgaris]TXD41249.1 AraC family transcriptional regulator [Lujinxingia vulgaris]